MTEKNVLVGISGASGAIYAKALVEGLLRSGQCRVLVTATNAARRVLRDELGAASRPDRPGFEDWLALDRAERERLEWLPVADIGGGPASGNFPLAAMAVAPCSMRTLAAIAHGLADNLLTRAADVCLKEGRPLVLAPRECPLSTIHLENMLTLARAGARIVPPMPGFYHQPERIEDLVRYVTQKIVEQMGLDFPDPIRWP